MIVAELVAPLRELRVQLRAHREPAFELDQVPLAVVEADRLDMRVAVQRPREAGRRVLPAGK